MPWIVHSRGGVLVCAALIWLGLDLGRSWNGHRAYRSPSMVWQPPSSAADLAWLPGADLPEGTPLGRRVFVRRCAVCHGLDGRGAGPAAPSMRPRPRDLTTGELKVRATPAGSPTSDEDLSRTIRDGLANSAMPAFSDLLSDAELRAVVAYVQELAEKTRPASSKPGASRPIEIPASPSFTPDRAEQGKAAYARLGCATCHGEDGTTRRRFEGADGQTLTAPDLTQPWTFRGGAEPDRIWLRLTTGMLPGPMPSYEAAATPEERWLVVAYLASIARTPPWEPGGKLAGLGRDPDLRVRGDYLSHAQICQLCHTTGSRTGVYNADALRLAGGVRVDAYPHRTVVTRNLTDVRYRSEEEIMAIVREGRMPDRQVGAWAMTWPVFRAMTDDDARALARYLRSLDGVPREIPEAVGFGVVETLAVKIGRGLPAAFPARLVYSDGDSSGLPSAAPVERTLSRLQWALGGLALLVVLFSSKRRGDQPFTRGWAKRLGLVFAAAAVVGALCVVYELPGYARVPPERVEEFMVRGLPPVDLRRADTAEKRALAERGRYLFNVSSCVICHGDTGAGGAKFSWKPFGTVYARNLTSDPEHGLGQWTDAQIARAIRSGISRDGRALHWQGMPWDMFSNFEEEDVRALVSYLRMLPPVAVRVNDPRPPSRDDCDVYSLFLLPPNQPPGCGD